MEQVLPTAEALLLLLQGSDTVRCLDVRSEGEFAQGALPGFVNLPILTNQERHLVGTTYVQTGSSEAIELGHRLVGPHRAARITAWKDTLRDARWPLVACWRGGMRSEIATRWLRDAGVPAFRVEGGYKALRRELLSSLSSLPQFLVIAGPTGARKTALLRQCQCPHIDLELLARHRGSAFGQWPLDPQPAQATFENLLGFHLRKNREPVLMVEDESMMIGMVHLPSSLRERMMEAPVVFVRMPLEERVENILVEYVTEPLGAGRPAEVLEAHYLDSVRRIQKKLGGLRASELSSKIERAFRSGEQNLHRDWIRDLLGTYYDPAYAYSFARANRTINFEGDWHACRQWIQAQFA